MEPVSMEDVARRAGVSTATVSRTLRGLPNVSTTTRGRVLAAAAELSYVVSPMASRLASRRTHTVGVVVPHAARWYFGRVVAGAETVLREAGLDLLLYSLGDLSARTRFFDRLPLRRRVDAVLTVAMALTEPEYEAVHTLGVPVVVAGLRTTGTHCVRIDDTGVMLAAVAHLVALGHRRIGMISTYADQSMWLPVAHERRAGYLAGLAAAGLADEPGLVVSVPFGVSDGERAMRRLMARPDRPTAVVAESDELAFGAVAAARRAGLAVPGDVSVIGIDDHDLSDVMDLTTVRQEVMEVGVQAGHMIVRAVAHPGEEPRELVLPTTLVVRGSTGPVAGS
jgi:LacI family transcriptional regulator, repressor for deo operon, udp, cdd, tsx, nupC, and nupG